MVYKILKQGGCVIIADWYNSMWGHPARVYEFLNGFEWGTKEQDLRRFAEKFPKALEKPPELSILDENANKMIRDFWRAWTDVRKEAIEKGDFDSNDEIHMLEGHRPVDKYCEELLKVGFSLEVGDIIPENPCRISQNLKVPEGKPKDSNLLMLLIGVK